MLPSNNFQEIAQGAFANLAHKYFVVFAILRPLSEKCYAEPDTAEIVLMIVGTLSTGFTEHLLQFSDNDAQCRFLTLS